VADRRCPEPLDERKFRLSDRQWEELEDIATEVASPGFLTITGSDCQRAHFRYHSVRFHGNGGAEQDASKPTGRALNGVRS